MFERQSWLGVKLFDAEIKKSYATRNTVFIAETVLLCKQSVTLVLLNTYLFGKC